MEGYILGQRTGRAIFEAQTDNFAGCLLMPQLEIIEEFHAQKTAAIEKFKAANIPKPDDKTLVSFIANEIALQFNVSQKLLKFVC